MAMPFVNEELDLIQPDGRKVRVRGTGNQYAATFETLDGHPIVRDVSGYFHYATLSNDGKAFVASAEVLSDAATPTALVDAVAAATSAVEKPIELGLKTVSQRWAKRLEQEQAHWTNTLGINKLASLMGLTAPPGTVIGRYVGLCLPIDFPDMGGTFTRADIDAFCNQPRYSRFGNNGSVRDYFLDVSDGKLEYENIVAPYYTAKHDRAYYTDETVGDYIRARELIEEALAYHRDANSLNFDALTADKDGFVFAVNAFYAGDRGKVWPKGLWPHQGSLTSGFALNASRFAYDYQITDMGGELTLGTFCHENGHMICGFPDLYNYGDSMRGVGGYCLMCLGGALDEKNPAQVGAYLKNAAGWARSIVELDTKGKQFTLGKNDFARQRRNSKEYFIIENRYREGRDNALPGSGLAVWHVHENGNNTRQHHAPFSPYQCVLVQADGRDDLRHGKGDERWGDSGDLFCQGLNDKLSDMTVPNKRWSDNSPSTLALQQIGPAGPSIRFVASK